MLCSKYGNSAGQLFEELDGLTGKDEKEVRSGSLNIFLSSGWPLEIITCSVRVVGIEKTSELIEKSGLTPLQAADKFLKYTGGLAAEFNHGGKRYPDYGVLPRQPVIKDRGLLGRMAVDYRPGPEAASHYYEHNATRME